MPSFPINRRFCTVATCWISRITNSEEGVVQCAPMVNVPHSPLSIVLKKNVAMFIFGCGLGNVRM